MGRKKIDIKFIPNKRERTVSSIRKLTFGRSASGLDTLGC